MYHSITIGSKNTWTNWHLVPTSRPLVEPPPVKTVYYEVPGADGSLDLTEYNNGLINYGDREGSWEFMVLRDYSSYPGWEALYSTLMSELHGKKFNSIILEDDPNYHYVGRLEVTGLSSDEHWSKVTIGYKLEPYKINNQATTDSFSYSTSKSYTFSGLTKPIIPTITCSDAMTVTYNGRTYSLPSGDSEKIAVIPTKKSMTFRHTGSTTVNVGISYYGGKL